MEKFPQNEVSEVENWAELPHMEIERLQNKLKDWLDQDPEEANNRRILIDGKVKHLKDVYPNWQKTQSMYLFIGGEPKKIEQVDFPNSDSVVDFIESL